MQYDKQIYLLLCESFRQNSTSSEKLAMALGISRNGVQGMFATVRLSIGFLLFLTGCYFALSDLFADGGFGDAFAWIFSAIAALILFAWFFEDPGWTMTVFTAFAAVAMICGVTSTWAHNRGAQPDVQQAYIDLMEIAAFSVSGQYGNELTPAELTILNRMMEDCDLQGAKDSLNLVQKLNEAQTLGPATSIAARSVGALTPNNPQTCQEDYEKMRNLMPELFKFYQKDLASLDIRPSFWSW